MVGADVAMLTSPLLRHGPDHLRAVEIALTTWMVVRLRVGPPTSRQRHSGHVRRPVGLRTSQLHANAALVDRAPRLSEHLLPNALRQIATYSTENRRRR